MTELGIYQGLLGFAAYFGAICLVLRLGRRQAPALMSLATGFAAYAVVLGLLILAGQNVPFWSYSVTYWCFVLSFLLAFGAIYKSISLRILLDLFKRPGRCGSYEHVLATYVALESYQNRLTVIQDSGFATRAGERYILSERGRHIASLTAAVQQVFAIRRSG